MTRLIFLLGFFLFTTQSFAQTPLSRTDFSKIGPRSIRKFLKSQMEQGVVNFEDFKPSVTDSTNTGNYDSNVHNFNLQQPLATTWKAYLSAHPATVWQGKVVSCGFIFSPSEKQPVFSSNSYPGLEIGQIFFIEMRILFRLIHFPVCFMVTGINENQHQITFSYISTGSSKGAQTIQLIDSGNGTTQIIHSSIHKTENKLRDRTLYPIYHKKAISEVHQNIRKQLQ